jgi:hypothetical protein
VSYGDTGYIFVANRFLWECGRPFDFAQGRLALTPGAWASYPGVIPLPLS